jgi:hypothetical protein
LTRVTFDAHGNLCYPVGYQAPASTTYPRIAGIAYFGGSIYFSDDNKIYSATPPWPATPATVYTSNPLETIEWMGLGVNGLVFGTYGNPAGTRWIYTFDGANATQIGMIEAGALLDICEANGIIYLLTLVLSDQVAGTFLPVIYQISGSTLAILDDFRLIDPAFWPPGAGAGATSFPYAGRLDSDGVYLYLFLAGLSLKRYLLTTGAVSDVGNPIIPAADTTHDGAVSSGSAFVEIIGDGNLYITRPTAANGGAKNNGTLTTSWFDFGVPDLDKSFDQIAFTFNNPTDNTTVNALNVSFQCNSPSASWTALSPTLAVNSNDVNFYLPSRTIGSRVRFQITLIGALVPDVQTYSVSATLARAWQVTVSCRRSQSARLGNAGQDPQQLTSTQLLANIKNAYTVAGGNVVLYMPDPTIDETAVANGLGPCVGVSQCYAVLQDYTWSTAAGVSPGYRVGMAPEPDGIEGDCQLVLTEQLG